MTSKIQIIWNKTPISIEYTWVGPSTSPLPPLIFLHEGLGSVSMWRAFPAKLCDSLNRRGLVYSRPGYGKSSPRGKDENWEPEFMHKQALEVLPALLQALNVNGRYSLFGHSDGGSISLLHAAQFPERVEAAVVLAPHIIVEDVTIKGIEAAKSAYETGGLKPRLAKYHDDVDSAFYGWNDVWLSPAFRSWDIRDELANIACPVLAVQGHDDAYGTMYQIDGIKDRVQQTELLKIEGCGHSPHAEKEAEVIAACVRFFGNKEARVEGAMAVAEGSQL